MNRGVRRMALFDGRDDYELFLRTLAYAQRKVPVLLFAYCVMPNHFHLVVQPTVAATLAQFMKRLTGTHSRRWHRARGTEGTGAVYQGRYRAFPVQKNEAFLSVCHYVERNPLRAKLVVRAEDWEWSSAGQRCRMSNAIRLAEWPILQPADWAQRLQSADANARPTDLRRSIVMGLPLGEAGWRRQTAAVLGLETIGAIGRPLK